MIVLFIYASQRFMQFKQSIVRYLSMGLEVCFLQFVQDSEFEVDMICSFE